MKPEWHAEGTHAWDMRHLIRTIVTSQTYRQSSLTTPQLEERDPDNRLLARQTRYRVEAEVVRDIALAASGLLVEKFGGPSAKPYEPDGYLASLNFPKREYSASHGDDLYRRGVYTFWQRSFLHPSLLTFDAPTREECTINRPTSNTPLQALGAAQRSHLCRDRPRVCRTHAEAHRRPHRLGLRARRQPSADGGGAPHSPGPLPHEPVGIPRRARSRRQPDPRRARRLSRRV